MNPDVYQGWWGGRYCRDSPVQTDRTCSCSPDHCLAGDNYYSELEQVFRYSLPRGKVAGFIAESIQVNITHFSYFAIISEFFNAIQNVTCVYLILQYTHSKL